MTKREELIEAAARGVHAEANDGCSDGPMEWDEAVELAAAAIDVFVVALRDPDERMIAAGRPWSGSYFGSEANVLRAMLATLRKEG